jgi:hypothetical protein
MVSLEQRVPKGKSRVSSEKSYAERQLLASFMDAGSSGDYNCKSCTGCDCSGCASCAH